MEDPVVSSTGEHWSQVAQRDLEFVHQTILDGHPGILEKSDEAFHRWFKDGYAQALTLAKSARNAIKPISLSSSTKTTYVTPKHCKNGFFKSCTARIDSFEIWQHIYKRQRPNVGSLVWALSPPIMAMLLR